jgi:hypothetical protein
MKPFREGTKPKPKPSYHLTSDSLEPPSQGV